MDHSHNEASGEKRHHTVKTNKPQDDSKSFQTGGSAPGGTFPGNLQGHGGSMSDDMNSRTEAKERKLPRPTDGNYPGKQYDDLGPDLHTDDDPDFPKGAA